jgi:hypothetical protein
MTFDQTIALSEAPAAAIILGELKQKAQFPEFSE